MIFSYNFLKTVDFFANLGWGSKKSWCRGSPQIRFAVGGVGFWADVGGVRILPWCVGVPYTTIGGRAHMVTIAKFQS